MWNIKGTHNNKITTSKFGSVLDDSIFEEIDRCKKLKNNN